MSGDRNPTDELSSWTREGDTWVLYRGVSTAPSARLNPGEVQMLNLVLEVNDRLAEADPTPTRANRGGQPLPVEGAVCVQDAWVEVWSRRGAGGAYTDALIDYTVARKALGIRRYGRPLETHNGRDALVDAFEEAFDLVMYLGQVQLERGGGLGDDPYPEHPGDDVDAEGVALDVARAVLGQLAGILLARDGKLPEVVE